MDTRFNDQKPATKEKKVQINSLSLPFCFYISIPSSLSAVAIVIASFRQCDGPTIAPSLRALKFVCVPKDDIVIVAIFFLFAPLQPSFDVCPIIRQNENREILLRNYAFKNKKGHQNVKKQRNRWCDRGREKDEKLIWMNEPSDRMMIIEFGVENASGWNSFQLLLNYKL